MKLIRAGAWLGGGVLVILAARAIVYGAVPVAARPGVRARGGRARAPVRDRRRGGARRRARRRSGRNRRARRARARAPRDAAAPPLRLGRLLVRAVALLLATSLGFALFESWQHWRAGLGWHGLHCLTGPVHRNAIPILAALSLVAAALAAALEHVLAWMRRTIARLRARLEPIPLSVVFAPRQPALVGAASCALGARGPRSQGSP